MKDASPLATCSGRPGARVQAHPGRDAAPAATPTRPGGRRDPAEDRPIRHPMEVDASRHQGNQERYPVTGFIGPGTLGFRFLG